MDNGQAFELVGEKPVHGGAVLATAPDERKVFLRGALPGEKVVAKVSADHKSYMWADTIEVLSPSEHRVLGVWPDGTAKGIGGIELAHASLPFQREWKRQVLAEQITRLGGPEVEVQVRAIAPEGVLVQPAPSDAATGAEDTPKGRRTRIQMTATEDGKLGMRQFRSHDIIPLDTVPVAVDAISDLSSITSESGRVLWKKKWRSGERVYIEAPSGSDPVIVTSNGTYRLSDGARVKSPSKWLVTAAGRTHEYRVRPGGFWQTHVDGPSVLVEEVLKAADAKPGQTILEFYSGAGLFSKFLAEEIEPGGELLTLEGDRRAVADAHTNLQSAVDKGIVSLFTGKVDDTAVLELASAAKRNVDTIVLDPPRKGAPREVVKAIEQTTAKRVVLVSCDPAAGMRDLRRFLASGFRLVNLSAWDLFPHTHHFETVAVLSR